ncbi:MAG: carbon storage regulator [Planctomycetota bacterium]
MLVLTRKRDEAIKIGDEIIIRVIHTGKGSVKLGIEAPAHIRVLRAELTEFPPTSPPSAMDSGERDDPMLNAPMSATKFLMEFDAEYVADLEDQLLVCTAS